MPGWPPIGSRSRIAPLAIAWSALVLQWAVGAGPASATTTCSLDPSTHLESITSDDTSLALFVDYPTIRADDQSCGSVLSVDTIAIDMQSVANAQLELDLGGGPFVPGVTTEADGRRGRGWLSSGRCWW